MFWLSASKDMRKIIKNNNDKRRIPTYPLVNLLTLIIKELKIIVEQGTVATT